MKVHTIVAVDFDDTIVRTENFPHIKYMRKGAAKYIRKLYESGYYIVIWTCRQGEHQLMAESFLQRNGIPYDKINEHHPQLNEYFKCDTRKVCADIYVDDKNLLSFVMPPWWLTYWLIKLRSYLTKKKLLSIFSI